MQSFGWCCGRVVGLRVFIFGAADGDGVLVEISGRVVGLRVFIFGAVDSDGVLVEEIMAGGVGALALDDELYDPAEDPVYCDPAEDPVYCDPAEDLGYWVGVER